METPKEVKEWAERIMSLKRKTCIEDRFIIDGDENESLEIAEDLKDMFKFSARKD